MFRFHKINSASIPIQISQGKYIKVSQYSSEHYTAKQIDTLCENFYNTKYEGHLVLDVFWLYIMENTEVPYFEIYVKVNDTSTEDILLKKMSNLEESIEEIKQLLIENQNSLSAKSTTEDAKQINKTSEIKVQEAIIDYLVDKYSK